MGVRKVAIAGAARSQSYQDASERVCGTVFRLFLLQSKKARDLSSLRVGLKVMSQLAFQAREWPYVERPKNLLLQNQKLCVDDFKDRPHLLRRQLLLTLQFLKQYGTVLQHLTQKAQSPESQPLARRGLRSDDHRGPIAGPGERRGFLGRRVAHSSEQKNQFPYSFPLRFYVSRATVSPLSTEL